MKLPMPRIRTTCTALIVSDGCALLISFLTAYTLRDFFGGNLPASSYLNLLPGMLLFHILYAVFGLYPGIMRPPGEELKWLSIGSSLGFLFLGFILFLGQQGIVYSRTVIMLSWIFALVLVPLFRYFTRHYFETKPWWGYPVLLFAPDQEAAIAIRDEFHCSRDFGLRIVETILLGDEYALPDEHLLVQLQERYPNALAFILGSNLSQEMRKNMVVLIGQYFRQVIVRLDTLWVKKSTLRVASVPGGMALTMQQNLLDPMRMRMKRLMDIAFCILGSVFLLIIIPLLAIFIRIDSRGPVFFSQKRVGQDGKTLRVWKFRTMVVNAQEVLNEILAANPEMRKEWEADQKLTNDPRLTRVGRFLRHTSLDELPQVFNVIMGDMSLVGPRPIVESEIPRYGEGYALYTRVKPGITGLWQVSGRNNLSYSRRVELDEQYVYNWSVWLDIYIMIRTIPALVTGHGAY